MVPREKEPSDFEIITEILTGNPGRFSGLVKRYSPLCYYYFQQRCGCDVETAKGMVQEVFMRVFKNLSRLEPDPAFRPWLMRICRNLAIDTQRKKSRISESLSRKVPDELRTVSPEKIVVKTAIIRDALQTLSDRQREIVEMHYFWGLSCSEIAEIMEIPEGTVKSDLYHARLRLGECLDGDEKN